MLDTLQSIDAAGFRWCNQTLANPLFDWLMPLLSGNPVFIPVLVVTLVLLLWRGGARGRVCVLLFLVCGLALNNLVVDWLKHAVARPRPFLVLSEARLLVGRGGSFSMPSSHAANWFAATAVVWWFYPRVARWLLVPAFLVGFSRVYNGVHYPSDVLAGAAVGALSGRVGPWVIERLWRTAGRRGFPLWWRSLPSVLRAEVRADPLAPLPGEPPVRDPEAVADRQWLRLGWGVIVLLTVARLAYLARGVIELSEDEAYQWLWSKHLALAYFSKPPLIAYIQFLGTRLWGDTEFGVRFFSPLFTAVISGLLLRFMAREVNARAAFWLLLMLTAAPLLSVGSLLMTVDPPTVLSWTGAMVAGWKAVQPRSKNGDWVRAGLWIAFGFLAKFVAVAQWLAFAIFLVVSPPARRHWRTPGPYLMLVISALGLLPVLIWNAQHGWVTAVHLQERAGLAEAWTPTLKFFFEHTAAMFGLLNPVFFGATLWAVYAVWRHRRRDAFLVYLWCMGVPLFFGYWAYTFRSRVLPNWIAPAVAPLFCLAVAYADARERAGVAAVRRWLKAGLWFGLPAVLLCHESNLVARIAGRPLPPKADPLRRVRAWSEAARLTGEQRQKLLDDPNEKGRPVFIIGSDYGITSQVSFYLPEAKLAAGRRPLVFCDPAEHNQFSFWPGYGDRKGQNAIYVGQYRERRPIPSHLLDQFESVEDLGLHEVQYRGRVFRKLQFFACHGLR